MLRTIELKVKTDGNIVLIYLNPGTWTHSVHAFAALWLYENVIQIAVK